MFWCEAFVYLNIEWRTVKNTPYQKMALHFSLVKLTSSRKRFKVHVTTNAKATTTRVQCKVMLSVWNICHCLDFELNCSRALALQGPQLNGCSKPGRGLHHAIVVELASIWTSARGLQCFLGNTVAQRTWPTPTSRCNFEWECLGACAQAGGQCIDARPGLEVW